MRVRFWDGSSLGEESKLGTIVVRSPRAFQRLLFSPGELGLARAYVAGELDIEPTDEDEEGRSDLAEVLRVLHEAMSQRIPRASEMALPLAAAARRLKIIGRPPPPPAAEVRLSSRFRPASIHTKERDAEAIRHHYDIGNDFYRLLLGPSLTYSCARFTAPDATLEDAQASKHELICRKLGLAESSGGQRRRLLDVGCGWGSMVIHAASHHDVDAVGVTLSPAQAELARSRVEEAGLGHRVEIRVQDYRDLGGERFDAISSIGMFEHVGEERMADYFGNLFALLSPHGRLLNHAISRPGNSKMRGRTFMNRYVFPDGELIDVGLVVLAAERAGFEVRDIESLREHYALTLRAWVSNLEANWEKVVSLVGVERARVWRFYMSASVNGFEDGGIAVHQVLGVRPDPLGGSGMPPTRGGWG